MRDEVTVVLTEPLDAVVTVLHVRVTHVETHRRAHVFGQVAQHGELEPVGLVADVLDDDFDTASIPGRDDAGQLLGGRLAQTGVVESKPSVVASRRSSESPTVTPKSMCRVLAPAT